MKNIVKVAVVISSMIIVACSESSQPLPDTSQAQPYTAIRTEEGNSSVGRKLLFVDIQSDSAISSDQRAHTAMKAAIELQTKFNSDWVNLCLTPSATLANKGYCIAHVFYSPDGNGKGKGMFGDGQIWEVKSSNYSISKQSLDIANLWYQNRDRFQERGQLGGQMTNEEKLKSFIAQRLNLKQEDVTLYELNMATLEGDAGLKIYISVGKNNP